MSARTRALHHIQIDSAEAALTTLQYLHGGACVLGIRSSRIDTPRPLTLTLRVRSGVQQSTPSPTRRVFGGGSQTSDLYMIDVNQGRRFGLANDDAFVQCCMCSSRVVASESLIILQMVCSDSRRGGRFA